MSWTHDIYIGEFRPWPDAVRVVRGASGEAMEYVPVVRCKDCRHFTPNKEFWLEPPKVPFPMIGATSDCCDFWADTECKVSPDGFCAWGERKDDA